MEIGGNAIKIARKGENYQSQENITPVMTLRFSSSNIRKSRNPEATM